jgi:DNA-binding response OmpR family regulator
MSKLNKIAYVEDDEDLRFLVQMSLEQKSDYIVKTYKSGYVFLSNINEFQPDLILLDVCMPDLDGVSLFLKIKEIPNLKTTPVVFFTAQLNPKNMSLYTSLGVKKIIAKPFNPIDLGDLLNSLLQNIET